MIAQIFDNLFDYDYMVQVEKTMLHLPVTAINEANGTGYPAGQHGTHKLFGENLFERRSINHIVNWTPKCECFFNMFSHIEEQVDFPLLLNRIDFNLQHSFCDGTSHVDGDPGDYTIMYMVNTKWDSKEWGGQFQIVNENNEVIEEHEYVPGRVLIFPSEIPHRGLGPRHPYVYRYTVVWRVRKLEDVL